MLAEMREEVKEKREEEEDTEVVQNVTATFTINFLSYKHISHVSLHIKFDRIQAVPYVLQNVNYVNY